MSNVPVVYYHSVGDKNPGWKKNYLSIKKSAFEEQCKFFSYHYNVISLRDYWLIHGGELISPRRPLIITFDDGYLDNWVYVFPLLKRYNLKATIFISPEFVDNTAGIRLGWHDLLTKKVNQEEINQWGFLSWEEMKVMEKSGLVDIQSHTLTHTKYFVSDKLTGFYHPGGDILYPIGNLYPEKKPYYIGNPDFDKLLPYGFPLFEEKSAIVARKVTINPDFINSCVERLKNYDFSQYDFHSAFCLVKPLYDEYRQKNQIIIAKETEKEYLQRVRKEIYESKKIIEEKLDKKVEFLCWPHGDNDETVHRIALEAGYLMTTIGKARITKRDMGTRIPERMGLNFSSWTKKQKSIIKLKAFSGEFPYKFLLDCYRVLT